MKRRPFFLIEVLIATLLIGVFSVLSIHGAFRTIHEQTKQLAALEEMIESDCARMDLVVRCWKSPEPYLGKKKIKVDNRFEVRCKKIESQGCYRLEISDTKSHKNYTYFIERQAL